MVLQIFLEEQKNMKVVILESDAKAAAQLSEYLQGDGFEVCGVSDSGSVGLALIEAERPDVALIGLSLKDLDGYGVLDKMLERGVAVPAVVTGCAAGEETAARLYSKGVSYYLIRPVSQEIVAARLREAAGRVEAPIGSGISEYTVDERISRLFLAVGIPLKNKASAYLRDAIKLMIKDSTYIHEITTRLYPEIAEKYGTKASDVERAIRHGITVAWERKKEASFNAVFGDCVCAKKPTNGDFIALAADRLLYGTFSKF